MRWLRRKGPGQTGSRGLGALTPQTPCIWPPYSVSFCPGPQDSKGVTQDRQGCWQQLELRSWGPDASAGNPVSRQRGGAWRASAWAGSPGQNRTGFWASGFPAPRGPPPPKTLAQAQAQAPASRCGKWQVHTPLCPSPETRRSRPHCPPPRRPPGSRPPGPTPRLSPARTFRRPPAGLLANGRAGNRTGQFRGPWDGEGAGRSRVKLQTRPGSAVGPEMRVSTPQSRQAPALS